MRKTRIKKVSKKEEGRLLAKYGLPGYEGSTAFIIGLAGIDAINGAIDYMIADDHGQPIGRDYQLRMLLKRLEQINERANKVLGEP